ncbi:DUF934 domain-containing protein [Pararhodobacter sp.]|uniref:DUF934 domain-containing protein n=1 Tax=Pararhodobacter sp. TaxID=2127056 RepID=UPI002B001210|nr:DUF934 domain-containing protein [Pararhodobacter sp.]
MSVLVTDNGFAPDDWIDGYVPLAAACDVWASPHALGIYLASPDLTARDRLRLEQLFPRVGLIRIRVRSFGDFEAYDLAKALRAKGFSGRLRAHGAMLARCYTFARWVGFDEIELDPQQARRQPLEHWRKVPDWTPEGHDARMLGALSQASNVQ